MFTVKIQGGLGNQMFQYAYGRAVSLHQNIPLTLDISFYERSSNRAFELSVFNINASIKKTSFLSTLSDKFKTQKIVTEPRLFSENVFDIPDHTILEGFWQSEKYFKPIADTIHKEFTLKNGFGEQASLWKNEIESRNAISVHIRRGDYLQAKHVNLHGVMPVEYHIKGMEILAEKVAEPVFFVFSDDIEWCKKNLNSVHQMEFIPETGISAPESILLMSACKHHLIANSSFSWWGAWLNPNADKTIVAPKHWFVDSNKGPQEIIPNNWIRI